MPTFPDVNLIVDHPPIDLLQKLQVGEAKKIRHTGWSKMYGDALLISHYIDGKRHRENGPSVYTYFPPTGPETKLTYVGYATNDEWHREDGPARLWVNPQQKVWGIEYCLYGKDFSLENYIQHPLVSIKKLDRIMEF